jgi:hypothetical protein
MDEIAKAIFRTQKLKTWGRIDAAVGHNERTRETANAASRVDNIVLRKPPIGITAGGAVREIIGDQTIRKNAVLAVEVVYSASPCYFRPGRPDQAGEWDESQLLRWRQAAEAWISLEFPHAISVVLHLDEATPHYQIIDVPLDTAGKLSCKTKFGGSIVLAGWQDRAAACVAHLGIERGERGSLAKHQSIRQFYAAVNATVEDLNPKSRPLPPPELPPRTPMERMPGTRARARREALEAHRATQMCEFRRRMAERSKFQIALMARGRLATLANRSRSGAIATFRQIRLRTEVLRGDWEACQPLHLRSGLRSVTVGSSKSDGSVESFPLRIDGGVLSLTRNGWSLNSGANTGRTVLDFLVQVRGLDEEQAVELLLRRFKPEQVAGELSFHYAERARAYVAQLAISTSQVMKPTQQDCADSIPMIQPNFSGLGVTAATFQSANEECPQDAWRPTA